MIQVFILLIDLVFSYFNIRYVCYVLFWSCDSHSCVTWNINPIQDMPQLKKKKPSGSFVHGVIQIKCLYIQSIIKLTLIWMWLWVAPQCTVICRVCNCEWTRAPWPRDVHSRGERSDKPAACIALLPPGPFRDSDNATSKPWNYRLHMPRSIHVANPRKSNAWGTTNRSTVKRKHKLLSIEALQTSSIYS